MKKILVSEPKTTFPVTFTISVYLLLKHFNANDFVMGIFWAFIFILWVMAIVLIVKQRTVKLDVLVEEKIKEKIKPTLDVVLKQLDELQKTLKR